MSYIDNSGVILGAQEERMAASPIAIFYGLPQTTFTLPTAVFSILALALGYVLSTKLGEK